MMQALFTFLNFFAGIINAGKVWKSDRGVALADRWREVKANPKALLIDRRGDRAVKASIWKCLTCGETTDWMRTVPMPKMCECGGVEFKVVRRD